MPKFNNKVSLVVRDLLQRIFVTDVSNRISLEDIKKHEFFRAIDFDKLIKGEVDAPWVPDEKASKTVSKRDSETGALMKKNPFAESNQERLSFDESHFK